MLERLKLQARRLKTGVYVLYLACRDPRTPWYAKAFAGAVVAYALSPLDLIPDPIPVLGYLDDLILIPLGIWVAIRLIPAHVLEDCRRAASDVRLAKSMAGAVAIVVLWAAAALAVGLWLGKRLFDW